MLSRKEEERNEKIIRGLMKLPPNRRCINCNGLGPQYVCTNFWTFVCTTCSGIHREFTHRVKSVSMAKFTSQEVDALQNGGNQRAREIFLKDWDTQRRRFPDSSNVDKIREFIKSVYVDRRFTDGKTSNRPPRDAQSPKNYEDDIRRASSYHSYSQSPPYEHQYEDRRYGKQTGVLTRKHGSDRGLHFGKISSFVYSPGRLREQMYEDRFANEGSSGRLSDYSMSSAGDPLKFDANSPTFQRGTGFNRRPMQPVRDILVQDAQRDVNGTTQSQINSSSGSLRSFDTKSVSQKSVSLGSLMDVVAEAEKSAGTQQPGTSLSPSSTAVIDLFANVTHQNSSTVSLEQKPPTVPFSESEGWATFDLPHHHTSAVEMKQESPAVMVSVNGLTKGNREALSSVNNSMQWSSVRSSTAHGLFTLNANEGNGNKQVVQSSTAPTNTQSWNAFDDFMGSHHQASFENQPQKSEPQVPVHNPIPSVDQYMSSTISEDTFKDGSQRLTEDHRAHIMSLPFDAFVSKSSFAAPMLPSVGGMPSNSHGRKSTNPFDLPSDSDLESSSVQFLNVSSLQAALPNPQSQTDFIGGLTQPWFPQSSVTPYIPSIPQGGLGYIVGQSPSAQSPNISSQGPVTSFGGNPFA
eukprot:TRINITY_DN1247_c0_g4_i1.p1 TRINITY_DN1247_c0_g4~~TRINITY_DN1247_c0_g4_i1.p1  ORF type:complete len:633 (-),score=96.45 TRINITY_DN1247_c0_g4_i1:416-2314(-)